MTQTKIICTPVEVRVVENAETVKIRARLFSYGEVVHPGHPDGKYTVDKEFIANMMHAFNALHEDAGYRPALLIEHRREGRVYGVVAELIEVEEGLDAVLHVPQRIADAIEAGELLYLSPTFYVEMPHPHTGEPLKCVLAEVSFVSVPHLKNIPPLSEVYAHSETGFVTQTKQEPTMAEQTNAAAGVNNAEETENMEEEVEQMEGEGEDKYAALNAKLDQILALLQPPEVEQEEEGEEVEQSLAEQVQELKQSIALKDAALVVRTALPDADEATVEQLAQLKVTNSELADATIAIHQSAKPGAPVVQTPIGQGGGGNTITVEQAEAMAEEAGCMTMSSKLEWIEKHQPQLKKKFLEA